jgi:hypothetical protein
MGEWRYSTTIPNLGTDGGEWSASNPGRLTLSERVPGTQFIGRRKGSKASLDAVENKKSLFVSAGNGIPIPRPTSP